MFWFWIIFFLMSCLGAKVSLLANQQGGKWFALACILTCVPYFPLMSIWTKSILADSFIYDFLIMAAYTGVYFLCGAGKAFGLVQYSGLVLTVLGIFLMKIKG